jgi:hypothetical protein
MASQVSICESQLGTRCEHLRDFPMAALCMVLLSATMAATAGTVCEWLFKETYATSIHLQNAQLYVWGCLANTAVFLVTDRERLRSNTVWHGFDGKVVTILVTLALQGLCVAAVVKHMSNVAKVFASAVGLFVAAIMSAVMDSFDITLPFALATVVVVRSLGLGITGGTQRHFKNQSCFCRGSAFEPLDYLACQPMPTTPLDSSGRSAGLPTRQLAPPRRELPSASASSPLSPSLLCTRQRLTAWSRGGCRCARCTCTTSTQRRRARRRVAGARHWTEQTRRCRRWCW